MNPRRHTNNHRNFDESRSVQAINEVRQRKPGKSRGINNEVDNQTTKSVKLDTKKLSEDLPKQKNYLQRIQNFFNKDQEKNKKDQDEPENQDDEVRSEDVKEQAFDDPASRQEINKEKISSLEINAKSSKKNTAGKNRDTSL